MSRFSNLEFDGQQESWEDSGSVAKDESYYLKEADALFAGGQFERALRWYSRVLEFNADSIEAWLGQVRMLIEIGEFHEARVWADKALERLPDAPELMAAKAVALGRLGDVKGAMAFSDAAIAEEGETAYCWLARGDVMLARKEKLADYCFEKALMLARGDWLYSWLVARACAFYEQFALALKYAQKAINTDATRAMAWVTAGQCQTALGMAGMARNSFEQARQLDPQCEMHKAMGDLNRVGTAARLRGWVRGLFQS